MIVHEITIRRCPDTGVWSSELTGHEAGKLKKRVSLVEADDFPELQTKISDSIQEVNNNYKIH